MEMDQFITKDRTAKTTRDARCLLSRKGEGLGFPTHFVAPVPTPDYPVHDGWFPVRIWPERWRRAYYDEGFAAPGSDNAAILDDYALRRGIAIALRDPATHGPLMAALGLDRYLP